MKISDADLNVVDRGMAEGITYTVIAITLRNIAASINTLADLLLEREKVQKEVFK
ncbi:MAG: hypothetical protein [Arizlama microvirus]|nr:MAG: hypothetical protein [Arizlama microvirus]